MDFPPLTGRKSRTKNGEQRSTTVHSQLTYTSICNATASVGAFPDSALQAAWSVILSTYVGAQDNVTFGTAIRSSNYERKSTVNDPSLIVPTKANLLTSGSWNPTTIGDILNQLTESTIWTVQSDKKAAHVSTTCEQLRGNGTIVVFRGKEHSENNEALKDEPWIDEKYALSISAIFSSKGLLTLQATYFDIVLDEPSALVVLAQLDDVLCYITGNTSKPIESSRAAIRPSLLSIANQHLPQIYQSHAEAPFLHTQFENTAEQSPGLVALEFWHDIYAERLTRWTYGELNARAEIFAAHLNHSFGPLSDKPIPICMERCPELYVAILGILKAGGAWCPVDASFPARRCHDLVTRTGSQILVVAGQELANRTESIPQGVAVVDITATDDSSMQHIDLSGIKMGSLAYLIWTSGTTGAPKGVPIHHEAALTSMRALQRSIPVDVAGDVVRCMQFSHFTFDVFVQDLFYTWGVGGAIVSSTRGIMLGSFSELANKAKATHAHLTPAFAASVPRQRCRTLEVITMIGEKLSQAVAEDWGRDMRAYNTYGPAETAVVSTLRRFGAADDKIQSENVGFPLPSVSAFVMRDGLPLMRNGVGELALGGPQLSKGYWHDPEKTAGRFIWNQQYARYLYMTGDIVRQLHDGSLEFVGREDDLIKIQGIRVELSEISYGLRNCHPLVEQIETQYLERKDRPSKVIVTFLATPKLDGHSGLIAVNKAAPIVKSALLEAQKNLADYMVPRVFLVVTTIPRTASNKIDRNMLKEIYSSIDLAAWERALATNDGNTTGEAHWSQRESTVIGAIAELSGTSWDSMSRHSDLRSIGIDSIAATRLAPMLHTRGFSISIADILQCQILEDILGIPERSGPRTQHYDLESFHNRWYHRVCEQIQRDDLFVAPALPLQESLLSESMQNARAYWSSTFLSLDAQVDLPRLNEAWALVAKGAEALRTGFIPTAAVTVDGSDTNSIFLQMIYNDIPIDWTELEAPSGGLKEIATQKAERIAGRHQKGAFKDPPFAITVFAQPEGRTLMITVHHSIRDELSLNFILEDVWRAYSYQDPKQRHQLCEALQLTLPTQVQIEQDEIFWSETLRDFASADDGNPFPNLSGDNLNGNGSFTTHIQPLTTGYASLQLAAINLGAASVASILRVAWGCILLMYLETDNTVFAETWSNRTDDPLLADIVGPLTSVLPVPFRANGSAREALVAQSRMQQKSRAHRSIHGRAVRRLLHRPEHQSLYPALFNFLPAASGNTENEWSATWRKLDTLTALTVEHPLALNVSPTANGVVELELIASAQTISSAHLAILAQQVDAIVEEMLKSPDVSLIQISARLPESLISKTSVIFSDEVKLASKQDPLTWVDHYAKLQPHWPAALFFSSIEETQHESWSYRELHSAYNRVAAFIRRHGYEHEMIAVCLDRRLEAYAVVLGILASGNTYLPIDEELPEERKMFLIQDSHAIMLFTTTTLAPSFTSTKTCMVNVDNDTYLAITSDGHPVEKAFPRPSDNAYLLYTSGSTGVPKGVLVGRGNLCSFIEGLSEYISPRIPGMQDLPGNGRYLGLASRAFDVHLAEMFLAWRQGLAAVTAPRTLLLDNLESALRTLKITHASFVPSLIDQAGLNPANLPNLHYLGVGGEKMSKQVVETWAASRTAALVNAYGPTEMSIGCTAAEVTQQSNLRNIGRPYGNSVAHVLVPGSNEHTLRGVAGELCFTGDLVANGYHNRPDAKGFVDDFFGKRMYRTGDIVRLMADDTIEYLRREDDQTKVRGQRLELGEISEAIRKSVTTTLGLDKVDVATIVAQHPKLSRPQLVNFIVVQRSEAESPRILQAAKDREMAHDIQNHCHKVLPSYMVPDIVLPLSRLPLAPASGKADQKRLKTLFSDIAIDDLINRSGPAESTQRALTKAEKAVRGVVANTLAINGAEIFSDTNIFRLGLESLSAINLAIKLQKLGYECTVSTVLKNPTLEQLALLPQKTPEKRAQTYSHVKATRDKFRTLHPKASFCTVKPCLPLQETLVAASLNDQSRAVYINNVVLKLSAEIDTTRLRNAWEEVVADHDILRTCFQEFQNGFIQIVHEVDETQGPSWEEIIVSDTDFAIHDMQRTTPINIAMEIGEKPPLRLTLLRQSAKSRSAALLFQIHHALYDGDSFAMILEDLHRHYHAMPVLPHTPFDSLIENVFSQDREKAKSFWKHYLSGYEPTSTMNHNDTGESFSVDRVLTNSVSDLEELSASISGTLTSTIEAVFGIVCSQMFKMRDMVFGAVLSGRTIPIESPDTIVAPCLTTIPQRVNLGKHRSNISDIMKVAREGFVESLTYQHTALRDIHRWVEADNPLFDCLVTFVQKKSRFHSDLWTELEGSMANEFALAVEFEADRESNTMRAHCAFTPSFGNISKANSLLENIDLLLGALVRRENVTTEDLGILDATKPIFRPHIWDESKWSPMELKMQKVAAEICGISAKDIPKGSSFFSLGIDSITAIRFAQQLRQSDIECSSADVMRHTCIAALAQHVRARSTDVNSVKGQNASMEDLLSKIPILSSKDIVTDVYQCTPLQSSMLTQTLGSDGRLYAHHHAIRLSATNDMSRLKQAWGDLIKQTEILRTTFHFAKTGRSWVAAVHQDCPNIWTESESWSSITQDFAFQDEASFEHLPWKTTIWKSPVEAVLVISMHHSLYDGLSINLLFRDLARLYNSIEFVPRSPFSVAARAISQTTKDAEVFWLRKIEGYQSSQHPSISTTPEVTNLERTLRVDIGKVLQGCKALGVTIQAVALLAYAKSLACIYERRDVVFGHVVGGRSLAMPGADDIVGPLFNTVPSRITLNRTYISNESMVKHIQQSSGESQVHQHASLAKIQQAWRQIDGNADAQLLDSVFVFLNNVTNESTIDSLGTPIDIEGAVDPTEYSLNVEFQQERDNIFLRVNAKMTHDVLGEWIDTFEQILQDILERPSRSVMAFPPSLQGLPLHAKSDKVSVPAEAGLDPGLDLDSIREALSVVSQIPANKISPDVSIFSLGLDSIAAIHVAATCRQQGYGISVGDVLQGRSLGGICRRFRESSRKSLDQTFGETQRLITGDTQSKARALLGLKEEQVEQVLPCLAGQIYHLASWLKTDRTSCEAVFIYQSPMHLDADLLRSAWRELRVRHSILRTAFVAVSPTEAVQVVLKPSALTDESFESIDSEGSIHDQIVRQANQPFDLFTPATKLQHVQGNSSQDVIFLKLHHATYDAWTIPTLICDLAALYRGFEIPSSCRFSSLINRTFSTMYSSQQQVYWRKSLSNYEPTLLTPSSINSLPSTTPSILITFPSAISSLQTLSEHCRTSSLSLSTLVLTAFARILARNTSTTHPTFGLYQTARSASFSGTETLCAPLLNITPLCVPDALATSIQQSARRIQTDLAERVAYEQSFLREILGFVGMEDKKPMFNTYVNILSSPPAPRITNSALCEEKEQLFTAFKLNEDEAKSLYTHPAHAQKPGKTAIDGLETGYIADKNLYLDVVRNKEGDCIDFAVRCEGGLMDERGLRDFVGGIVREITGFMEETGKKGTIDGMKGIGVGGEEGGRECSGMNGMME
ncbi:MAG: hypothetical protein Q9172_001112 [Xanthocarpia lactea]